MDYINKKEACEILGISLREFERRAPKYMLKRYYPYNKRVAYYDPNEVATMSALCRDRSNYIQLAGLAYSAHLDVMRLERRLDQLVDALGFDLPTMKLDEESVMALYLKAQDALKKNLTPQEVYDWIRTISTLGEEYFFALHRYTREDHPWKPFHQLIIKMLEAAPFEKLTNDPEYKFLYKCLNAVRKAFRDVIIMYTQSKFENLTLTARMFPQIKGDLHETILALMEPTPDS